MDNFAKKLVYNRLRIMRGQSFVGILFATMTFVGVWRASLPFVHWWLFAIIIGGTYLGMAWVAGYVDERYLFRIEQARYSEHNPQLMEIHEAVKRIEGRLEDVGR